MRARRLEANIGPARPVAGGILMRVGNEAQRDFFTDKKSKSRLYRSPTAGHVVHVCNGHILVLRFALTTRRDSIYDSVSRIGTVPLPDFCAKSKRLVRRKIDVVFKIDAARRPVKVRRMNAMRYFLIP